MSDQINQIGSDMQGSDFVVITKLILNHMQSQFMYNAAIAKKQNRV